MDLELVHLYGTFTLLFRVSFLITILPVYLEILSSDGSGSKIFDPGRVESIFCGSGRVGSGQPFMVWV